MPPLSYCIITNCALYRQPLHEVAQAAEEASIDYFQLREKTLTSSELLVVARHIRPMLSRTRFIVNGALDVAVASGADGVHLQKDNLPVSVVRKTFPHLIIGYSAHSFEELVDAQDQGASYAFASPLFAPRSKNASGPLVGVENLTAWTRAVRVPVFALGGISVKQIPILAATGCAGIAGISLFMEEGRFRSPAK